jgi:hypothetical protein
MEFPINLMAWFRLFERAYIQELMKNNPMYGAFLNGFYGEDIIQEIIENTEFVNE